MRRGNEFMKSLFQQSGTRYLQCRTNRKSCNYDLSNGTIFNDLEQPLPPVSRSLNSL